MVADPALVRARLLAKQNELWKSIDSTGPTRLFHFSATGIPNILQSQSLWCTDIRGVNDPDEVTYGQRLIRKALREMDAPPWLREHVARSGTWGVKDTWTIYVACFTGNPCQKIWEEYAGGGTGGALVFDYQKLFARAATGGEYALFPIVYDPKEQEGILTSMIEFALRDLRLSTSRRDGRAWSEVLFSLLGCCASRFKAPCWASEQEHRLGIWFSPELGLSPFENSGKSRLKLPLSSDCLVEIVRGWDAGVELSENALDPLTQPFGEIPILVQSAHAMSRDGAS